MMRTSSLRGVSWIAAALALATATGSCQRGSATGPRGTHTGGHPVLFIGNSLTYTNDLPGMVRQLGQQANDSVDAWTLADPDRALVDFVADGRGPATIKSYAWELVVMQQGPSTVGVNRDTLVLGAKQLDVFVRQVGGRSALFMVWPDQSRAAFFDACRESYRAAADAVGGVFLPAGESWRAVWAKDPSLALYGPDGYHPSPLGSWVAALTIFERITGRDARTLPAVALAANGQPLNVSESTVRMIQQAVHETNAKYPP